MDEHPKAAVVPFSACLPDQLDGNGHSRPLEALSQLPRPNLDNVSHLPITFAVFGDDGINKAYVGSEETRPLFRVTSHVTRHHHHHHRHRLRLPDRLTLRHGTSENSPSWSSIDLKRRRVTIISPAAAAAAGQLPNTEIQIAKCKRAQLNDFEFTMAGPAGGRPETFGWRSSSCEEVRELECSRSGMKLVRVEGVPEAAEIGVPVTNDGKQIVAILAWGMADSPVHFKFQFLDSFGQDWELVAASSALAIWAWKSAMDEKRSHRKPRRRREASSHGIGHALAST